MSALAGRWNFDGEPSAAAASDRMLRAQQIYGPDNEARWDGGEIALGRRLFRLLPEDAHDRGPLAGGDGRYRLVADVRLDNRDELADQLRWQADQAAALPDAAFLVAAWERWREGCFAHLLGDYAFALWDEGEQRLVLARDAMGARPLHYHRSQNFVAFASMPKGLHALGDVPRAPDEERVAEFLALLPEHGPASFFAGISRVEAGHFVSVTAAGTNVARHWNPQGARSALRGADAADGLREQLDRAVLARLRGAQGQVAAHLSGGFDSAAVTATAARLLAPRHGTVVAFTSVPRDGYDLPIPKDRIGDEGPLAAATAALHPNIEHVLVRPPAASLFDGLDRDFFLADRPQLNLCNLGWWNAINAGAKDRGIKIVLTGALGNMTISYAGWERLAELAGAGRLPQLVREGRALVAGGHIGWLGVVARAFGPRLPGALWMLLNRVRSGARLRLGDYSLLRAERAAAIGVEGLTRSRGLDSSYRPNRSGLAHRLGVLRRFDQGNFNKAALGGWGVDLRDPTADARLIEFCLALPTDAFLDASGPRALARRAFADRLPAAVLDEKRKGLQAIDWHESLDASRAALGAEIARLERTPSAATALDLPRLHRLFEQWPAGDWNSPEVSTAYRAALLRGVASGHFLRKASGGNG